jgi:hypothetical protein
MTVSAFPAVARRLGTSLAGPATLHPAGPGPQGLLGEYRWRKLTTAINGTSTHSNAVTMMDTAFVNDPPTLADLELMRAKMNELITAMRR